jgi:hypothetical protein
MELSGTTRQVSSFGIELLYLLLIFRKIDWHALESARVLSQLCSACCVLGAGCGFCVNTLFGTPSGTHLVESLFGTLGAG